MKLKDYKQLLAEANDLLAKAKVVAGNPDASDEDKAQVPEWRETAKGLRGEAAEAMNILEEVEEQATLESKAQKFAHEQAPEDEGRLDPTKPEAFKEFGPDFLQACWRAEHKSPQIRRLDPRLRFFKEESEPGHESKQMVESVGASGGFLVPTEFMARLYSVGAEDAIMRPRASIIRMNRRQIDIPVLDQTGTTSGRPHWFGGMRFYWGEEAEEKTETEPKFRKVSLVAHKLIGYTRSSDELVDDSAISLSDYLSGELGFLGGVRWMEDYHFLRGTGVGQPLGIINAGATITVARQAGGTVGYIDLANMDEHFLPQGRGLWVISQSLKSELRQVQDPAGNYVWQPNARDGIPNTIFGWPVIFTEKVPLAGVAGDVLLIDPRYYLLGDRQATTIESTQYDYWRYDQTSWRVVHRVDGQPWLSTYLTMQDGTTTVSPFVMLSDKST